MEIWYTLTGTIDKNSINNAIVWLNTQIYSNPIKNLKVLISSNGGDIDAGHVKRCSQLRGHLNLFS